MATILLAGATGLVGKQVLAALLADPRVERVVAPTRRALEPHPKLESPMVDFARLPEEARWWAVDGAICTLGTTRKRAGSDAAFREVDHDYPLAVARLTRARGAARFALTSAQGADARSRFLYMRVKGEVEEAIGRLGFPSLTVVRPGLIGGEREERRTGERLAFAVLGTLGPVLPRKYRISPAARITQELVAGAIEAAPGRRLIEAAALAAP